MSQRILSIRRAVAAPIVGLGIALTLAAACLPAAAGGQLTGYYFLIPHSHPDTGKAIDGYVPGLVAQHLGPHGLPVVTALGRSRKFPSGPIADVNSYGELMWWSASGTRGVKLEKIQLDSLPFHYDNFYPDRYGNDASYYRSVRWRGEFSIPSAGKISLTLESDDDSWVFIDGTLAIDNGGIKAPSSAPYEIKNLTAGSHVMDIFYVDRYPTQALMYLTTSVNSQPVGVSMTTEQMAAALKTQGHFALHDIHFAFDKSDITEDSAVVLAEVSKLLHSQADLHLRVEGHTDNVGSAAYNLELSQRRAAAVKAYLVNAFGIDASRLATAGLGFSKPVASNDTSQGRALNRRVEFVKT